MKKSYHSKTVPIDEAAITSRARAAPIVSPGCCAATPAITSAPVFAARSYGFGTRRGSGSRIDRRRERIVAAEAPDIAFGIARGIAPAGIALIVVRRG